MQLQVRIEPHKKNIIINININNDINNIIYILNHLTFINNFYPLKSRNCFINFAIIDQEQRLFIEQFSRVPDGEQYSINLSATTEKNTEIVHPLFESQSERNDRITDTPTQAGNAYCPFIIQLYSFNSALQEKVKKIFNTFRFDQFLQKQF